MSAQERDTVVATVVGRGPDTPYVLVEVDDRQFMVNRKVYSGDWDALQQGDVLELVIARDSELSKVFASRLLPR